MDHFSDTTYKTFLMDERIGISFCGNATINNAPISGYIEDFMRENKDCGISELPEKIRDYFHNLASDKDTIFFVAGYELNGDEARKKVFRIHTNAPAGTGITEYDTSFSNAIWDGERDTASRLFTELYIKGIDEHGEDTYTQHSKYELARQHWTLQDAIEFAEFLICATINCMKFQKRPKTVGGPVDILVLKPEEALWIKRKILHSSD